MPPLFSFFFFNDTATTEIYTLSLHDALPISPITNVTFTLEVTASGLTNFSLAAPTPPLASATMQPTGPGTFQVSLQTLSGQTLLGAQTVSTLNFAAPSNAPSAFVWLQISNLSARQANGSVLSRMLSNDGRVIPRLRVHREPTAHRRARAHESNRFADALRPVRHRLPVAIHDQPVECHFLVSFAFLHADRFILFRGRSESEQPDHLLSDSETVAAAILVAAEGGIVPLARRPRRSADFQICRIAGFQPAEASSPPKPRNCGRSADWKSAIQQVGNLYTFRGARPERTPGCAAVCELPGAAPALNWARDSEHHFRLVRDAGGRFAGGVAGGKNTFLKRRREGREPPRGLLPPVLS